MNREDIIVLLERYRLGKTTNSENKKIERFLDSLQQKDVRPLLTHKKEKELFKQIEKQIPEFQKEYPGRNRIAILAIASIAACLCLVFWPTTPIQHNQELSFSTNQAQDSIELSDGSTVYLSQNTTISYPDHFGDKARRIRLLKGSAFFKVTPDQDRPFSVITDSVTTRVLGTSFNVSVQDSLLNVTVATGKVKVSSSLDSIDLVANEQAQFSTEKGLEKRSVDSKLYSNWMQQNVDYGSITLNDLSTVMRLRFGIPFSFQDESLKNITVRVSILNGEDVESVISKLNYITKYNLKIDNNVINVSKPI